MKSRADPREKWEAIRSRGMTRFILFQGIVLWGGAMAFFTVLMSFGKFKLLQLNGLLPYTASFSPSMKYIGTVILIWVLGGALWGASTWYLSEWWFRRRLR